MAGVNLGNLVMGTTNMLVPNMATQGCNARMGSFVGTGGVGISPLSNTSPFGVVTCYICGRRGHYAQNCWRAKDRQIQRPDKENIEMRELIQRINRQEREEEERRLRENVDAKKKEENERRESETLREEEAKEAKLEAAIVRILTQRKDLALVPVNTQTSYEVKKKSPRSKARFIQEITNYIAESEDDSEEVKEETSKLFEVLEKRKKKDRRTTAVQQATASKQQRAARQPKKDRTTQRTREPAPAANGFETPVKACPTECSSEGMVEYALSQTKILSAMKAHEIRKICNKEGVEYTVKSETIQEIVRCLTRLAHEGFLD
ncbi:hypothetical protein CBR_g50378 [Chara braunii]|uniref:CCHC-type domain-containing protein n=1 Tax=Chara braunii TaxID=69332 RepID=A0A388M6H3_CHABU|nr:hypothetical protein CBR_g50378 [Chara braunii]|eukprot:GBG90197.1 hypothetical protein CBR_g50378 [Chara braunii]